MYIFQIVITIFHCLWVRVSGYLWDHLILWLGIDINLHTPRLSDSSGDDTEGTFIVFDISSTEPDVPSTVLWWILRKVRDTFYSCSQWGLSKNRNNITIINRRVVKCANNNNGKIRSQCFVTELSHVHLLYNWSSKLRSTGCCNESHLSFAIVIIDHLRPLSLDCGFSWERDKSTTEISR